MTETARNLSYSIQYIPISERPRERLMKYGPEMMTTAELIAIILGSGMKGISVLQLSHDIIAHFGNMESLAEATIEELCKIKGLGPAKALQLKAAISLGERVTRKTPDTRPKIEHPIHAYNFIKTELEKEKRELFMVILLDAKGYAICHQTISVGTISHTIVHPREVFNPAIRHSASSMILAHNHPSGDPTPSQQDYETTQNLVEVSKVIGIPVNDHLIIGKNSFISIREKNSFIFNF